MNGHRNTHHSNDDDDDDRRQTQSHCLFDVDDYFGEKKSDIITLMIFCFVLFVFVFNKIVNWIFA